MARVRTAAADVGAKVRAGDAVGEIVELSYARRGPAADDDEEEDGDAAAKAEAAAAAKAAEAERKAAKLKAMEEKMRKLGLM